MRKARAGEAALLLALGFGSSCFVEEGGAPTGPAASSGASTSDSPGATETSVGLSGSSAGEGDPDTSAAMPDSSTGAATIGTGQSSSSSGAGETTASSCEESCPSGVCVAGECGLRVFVSSVGYAGGELGSLAEADLICDGLALDAGLDGTFRAWLSSNEGTPADRFDGGLYVRMDGLLLASDFASLITEGPAEAINLDEYVEPAPATNNICGGGEVITGTLADGSHDPSGDCDGWSNPVGDLRFGDYEEAGDAWTEACSSTLSCSGLYPIYCFEQAPG